MKRPGKFMQGADVAAEMQSRRDEIGSLQTSVNGNTAQLVTFLNKNDSETINVLFPRSPLIACKGDGFTDDTTTMQNLANLGKPLVIPKTDSFYLVSGTIQISNSIIGAGMPEIRMSGTNGTSAKKMFIIPNYQGKGLHVTGLYLYGGYTGGTLNEQSHLIHVGKSNNVYIHHNILEAPYGDCVYIGSVNSTTDQGISENIHVYKNMLKNPRRCAVAVVNARKVWIEDNIIDDPFGYVAAIDIEPNPNNGVELVEDVWIKNNEFYSTIYFVNFLNPNADYKIQRITIEGNKGKAHYFVREAATGTGKLKDIRILNNEFYGSIGEARMILLLKADNGLEIKGNIDRATGANGWRIDNSNNPIVKLNKIDVSRSMGIVFHDCNNIEVTDNTFKDVYSSYGALTIQGSSQMKGQIIRDNRFINTDYAINVQNAVILESEIDGNYIESARRAINIVSSAIGSEINITNSNRFVGAGTPLTGQTNLSTSRPTKTFKGLMFYDLTLNKPIWFNGTSWVDATGTTV